MKHFIYALTIVIFSSCTSKPSADIIFVNATIYTMNSDQPTASAVAIKGSRIAHVGTDEEVLKWKGDNSKVIDLEGKTMIPGFIESHGHLIAMGYSLLELDLSDTKSYAEIVSRVEEAASKTKPGEWILGRGWHQSKWDSLPEKMVKGFQTHDELSAVTPDNPVYLRHASGHAAIANAKAMELAGVNQLSIENLNEIELEGGEMIKDANGNPTGIFNENAEILILTHVPKSSDGMNRNAFELAMKECNKNGITSFHDASADKGYKVQFQEYYDLMTEYRKANKLSLRLNLMLPGWNKELTAEWFSSGIEADSLHWITVCSVKLNCDGALGSRGAWLLEEYTDMPGHFGHETQPMTMVTETSEAAIQAGFQVCSHAIGDRTNREILDRYESTFLKYPDLSLDHRFRIEHAQHIDPDDIPRFGKLGVIASMQAIHMSSDRPWAIDRLGETRIKEGAYMWQDLLQSGAKVINGTDVPIEPINPLACFYASVNRKTLGGQPEGGYEPEQKMSREQALRSYTIEAAYGEFAENVKGSIEVGKLADLTYTLTRHYENTGG